MLRAVERARELLRYKHPDGRLEAIFAAAIDALLDRIDPERVLSRGNRRRERALARRDSGITRHEATAVQEEGGRRIPAAVRAEVWQRDGGRCAYIGPSGRRCGERGFLEVDHVRPFSLGGRSDEPGNLRLLCRAHNQMMARLVFGDEAVRRRECRPGSEQPN